MAKIESKKTSLTTVFWKGFMADPFKDGDRIYTDAEEKGLELRIVGKKASWITRYKKMTKTIGCAVAPDGEKRMLTTPKEARQVHGVVKGLIDIHPDRVDYFLAHYYAQPDPKKRDALWAVQLSENDYNSRVTKVSLRKSWTLQQCVDNYIEKRTDGKSKEQLKPSSVADFQTTFARKEVAPYLKRSVAELSPEIAERVRDQIEREYGPSPSKKWVSNLRSLLTYTMKYNRSKSGLDKSDYGLNWWMTLTDMHESKRKTRMPSLRGIGVTLALAEQFSRYPMPGRDGIQHGVRPNVLAGLWWLVLSGQRIDAAVKLKRENWVPYDGFPGWKRAGWTSEYMKGGRAFTLPVPPKAVAILDNFIRNSNSQWCFQSERAGQEDIPINRSAVLNVLKRLAGTDATARESGEPGIDLFALNGERYWSPHDIRRALTELMEQEAIPGGASAILDHMMVAGMKLRDDQLEEWNRQVVAEVTKKKYGDIQHLGLKGEAMELWVDAVLESYERARKEGVVVDTDGTLSTDTAACERKHKELLARYAQNKRSKKAERAKQPELVDA